jgi:hypothetical protein
VDKTDGAGNVKGDLLVRRCATALGCTTCVSLLTRGCSQGTFECRLSDIVGARGCTLLKPLASKRSKKARKTLTNFLERVSSGMHTHTIRTR